MLRQIIPTMIFAALVWTAACSNAARQVRMRFMDAMERPVSEVLLYVESADPRKRKAVDFVWAVSGPDGNAPADGSYLNLKWTRKTILTVAVLTDERESSIYFHHRRNVPAEERFEGTWVFTHHRWNDRTRYYSHLCGYLSALAFPFEDEPRLAEKLARPENRPLVDQFETFYKDPEGYHCEELDEKRAALKRWEKRYGASE